MKTKKLLVDNKYYTVSECGRIWSHRGCEIKQQKCTNGYFTVHGPYIKGKNKRHLVHRLVAMAFVDNPGCKKEINHKDLDKSNNAASNLEWSTRAENNLHASAHGARGRPVVAESVFGDELVFYPSAGYAARVDGFDFSTIAKCCNGKRTHHKGYKWSWARQ